MIDIKALEEEVRAAEQDTAAAALTDEEKKVVALLERKRRALEERAAEERSRREVEMARRERAARAVLGSTVLVKAVDIVSLFEVGYVPPREQLPGGGVVVVRSPLPSRMDAFYADIEMKRRSLPAIYADLLCEHVVDPDVQRDAAAGALLRAFCDAYQPASIAIGDEVAKLGGSKAKADKRGRA